MACCNYKELLFRQNVELKLYK